MTRPDDLEPLVGQWLKDEARPMPPEVLAAVREAVPRTTQLGRRGLPGSGRWGRWPARLAMTAVAAALVVTVGPGAVVQFQSWLNPVGVVGQKPVRPSPSPVLTPSPSEAPSPSPTEAPSPSPSEAPSPSPSEAPSPTARPSTGSDPFTGSWSANDVDGSPETIVFTGKGKTRSVVMEDLRGTACGGAHYFTSGTGTVTGRSIRIVAKGGCDGRPKDQAFDETWTYDPTTGSLASPAADLGTLTWTRGPIKPDSFSGTWVAADIDGGSLALSFSGSGMGRAATLTDDRTPDCGPGVTFSAQGTATIGSVLGDGRYVLVTLHGACAGGAGSKDSVAKFKYEFLTNTLTGPLAPLEIGGNTLPETVSWSRG